MKKINSNGYAGKVLLTGFGILAAGIPLRFAPGIPLIVSVAVISIGAAVLAGFALLLAIEFCQDRRINKQYTVVRTTKIQLPGGFYECQACGNSRVQEDHETCLICGNRFT